MRRKIKKWKGKLNVIFCQNCPGMGGGRRRRVEREIKEFKNVGKVIFVIEDEHEWMRGCKENKSLYPGTHGTILFRKGPDWFSPAGSKP